jgi:hypothetical protein
MPKKAALKAAFLLAPTLHLPGKTPIISHMTREEFQAARKELGVSMAKLGRTVNTHERTVAGWNSGDRLGKPAPVPKAVALLLELALKYPPVRQDLFGARPRPRKKASGVPRPNQEPSANRL